MSYVSDDCLMWSGRAGEQTGGRTGGRTSGRMGRRTGGRADGQADKRMGGREGGRESKTKRTNSEQNNVLASPPAFFFNRFVNKSLFFEIVTW